VNRTWLIGKVFERAGNSKAHLTVGALRLSEAAFSMLVDFGCIESQAMSVREDGQNRQTSTGFFIVTPWGLLRVAANDQLEADNLYYDRHWVG
jgi:hypothetical protein